MDPYKVLGVGRNATEDEIKQRYGELIEEYTMNQDANSGAKIDLLNQAYDILISRNIYFEIRQYIENKNFPLAESKLNMINDRTSAEWNYLEGFVCVQKGWFELALNYIKKAVELDPDNPEYRSSLNTLQSRIFEYATRYATTRGVKPAANNNMNGCGGNSGGGNGGMC